MPYGLIFVASLVACALSLAVVNDDNDREHKRLPALLTTDGAPLSNP